MRKIEAHPDAAIFPMMSADDLANLAADIKANGQVHPIVIGKIEVDGKTKEVIVDGRNRYEACEIAGVEPKFTDLNGHDPKAFILSSNIVRRHMTAGQRAMAYARIYPMGQHGGARKPKIGLEKPALADFPGVTSQRVADARIIIEFAADFVEAVISGATIISDGVKEAKKRKAAASTEEAKMDQLREAAPDLADLVVEGMKLDEAVAAAKERAEGIARQRKLVAEEVNRTLDFLVQANIDPRTRAEQITALFDASDDAPRLDQAIATLEYIFKSVEKGEPDVG
jgi:uncharacterized ParB-like nuclease family protein